MSPGVPTGFLTSVGKFLANLVQQKALHRRCSACHRDEHASYMITSPENQYRDHHTRCLLLSMSASYRHIEERIKKAVDDLQTQSNLSPTLLLLHGNSMYHVKGYNIDSRETHPRLSPEDKIRDFLKLKRRRFVSSLTTLIRTDLKFGI